MSIEPAEFRHILGQFASGVTVITTQYLGQLHGTTVSSFCSLSLKPPLVLVCIDLNATIHDLITQSKVFGVNILTEQSEATSRHFARQAPNKFSGILYGLGQTGVPLPNDALATLECRVATRYPGGDHSIFIGEVITASMPSHGQPLLYFRSTYNGLISTTVNLTKR